MRHTVSIFLHLMRIDLAWLGLFWLGLLPMECPRLFFDDRNWYDYTRPGLRIWGDDGWDFFFSRVGVIISFWKSSLEREGNRIGIARRYMNDIPITMTTCEEPWAAQGGWHGIKKLAMWSQHVMNLKIVYNCTRDLRHQWTPQLGWGYCIDRHCIFRRIDGVNQL